MATSILNSLPAYMKSGRERGVQWEINDLKFNPQSFAVEYVCRGQKTDVDGSIHSVVCVHADPGIAKDMVMERLTTKPSRTTNAVTNSFIVTKVPRLQNTLPLTFLLGNTTFE